MNFSINLHHWYCYITLETAAVGLELRDVLHQPLRGEAWRGAAPLAGSVHPEMRQSRRLYFVWVVFPAFALSITSLAPEPWLLGTGDGDTSALGLTVGIWCDDAATQWQARQRPHWPSGQEPVRCGARLCCSCGSLGRVGLWGPVVSSAHGAGGGGKVQQECWGPWDRAGGGSTARPGKRASRWALIWREGRVCVCCGRTGGRGAAACGPCRACARGGLAAWDGALQWACGRGQGTGERGRRSWVGARAGVEQRRDMGREQV